MVTESLKNRWQAFLSQKKEGMMDLMNIRITSISEGAIQGTMPVTKHVKQPFGWLHGGASVAFAETLASLGSWMLLHTANARASAMEINANHLSPVSEGNLLADAVLIHKGSRIHIWVITIRDDQKRLICTSRCTVSVNEVP